VRTCDGWRFCAAGSAGSTPQGAPCRPYQSS